VPQPVGLGAGDAFARPLRAALTALAVLVGVATVVFALGLRTSLERSQVMFVDWTTYQQVQPDASPSTYFVSLRPGADAAAYARRVTAVEPDFLGADLTTTDLIGPVQTIDSVTAGLAAVLAVIAVARIFNTVLLSTRERVRDVAVLKAIGMTPAQVLAMVVTSAGVLALVGGVLGVPVGLAVHHVLTGVLQTSLGNDAPRETLDVFTAPQVASVLLAGLVVAMLAAALPARWAARTPVAQVLRSE
jgi:putative ABC transport system permease protein